MTIEGDTPLVGTATQTAALSAAELFAAEEDDLGNGAPVEGEEQIEGEEAPQADDTTDSEDEKSDEAEPTDDEEDQPDETEEPQTIEIDGKTVTLEEVRKGYLRQEDYTRKTQALAEEKREFGQAIERVTQQDQQARHALELAQAIFQTVIPPMPNAAMLETDPIGYVRAKEAHEQAVNILNQLDGTKRQTDERMTAAQREAEEKAFKAELALMQQKLPELATPENREKFRNNALELGAKFYDLTPAEIDSIRSYKELAILKDALAYRKLQSEKMTAVSAAKKAPKLAKPGPREKAPANTVDRLRKLGQPVLARHIFADME